MLFAIGAGPDVVAVSSFDRYPPDVGRLPRVGALLDPDLERILALRPDLVIVYGTQTDLRAQLDRAGVPMFLYEHAGLADVTATIRALGRRTGRAEAAERTAAGIEARLTEVRSRLAGAPRPRTLLVFGREAGALRTIFASGGVGFLHDMLEAAGGENVMVDVARQAIQMTTELILARRPDVILELRTDAMDAAALERERRVWRVLSSVPAVRNGRVHILADESLVVPGPRVAAATERIARVLHPDVWLPPSAFAERFGGPPEPWRRRSGGRSR
jgi:iron complex transport system substrate-binding protein